MPWTSGVVSCLDGKSISILRFCDSFLTTSTTTGANKVMVMEQLSRFVSPMIETGARTNTFRGKKKQVDGVVLSERERVDIPCGPDDYNLFNYLSYSLYSPLYLAGPIITYNDFIAQVCQSQPAATLVDLLFRYATRFRA